MMALIALSKLTFIPATRRSVSICCFKNFYSFIASTNQKGELGLTHKKEATEGAAGSFWAATVRAAGAAEAAAAKAAAMAGSGGGGPKCVVISSSSSGGSGGGGKFAELYRRVLAAAESNLDPLDMVTLRMEADAAKALAESEAKEAERAAAMKGKDVVIDEEVVDLGFTYNPAAHCYICKQRGHTKVGRLVGRSVGGSVGWWVGWWVGSLAEQAE